MPRNRKYYLNRGVHFITSRTEEGLPLVPSHVMNYQIWGILARAKELYRVRVCHFVFMGNHFHMVIVVENPGEVDAFIGYVKCEIAHVVNKMLGRRQKTIWQEGYDSPLLLTPEDVLKYIVYTYMNPVRADLVKEIGDYPGVSSWRMFSTGVSQQTCKKIKRPEIPVLETPALSINEQKRMVDKLASSANPSYEFELEPYAWLESFDLVGEEEKYERLIREEISKQTARCAKERVLKNREVVGATTLRRQSMEKEHTPRKHSRRMVCICYDRGYRRRFLESYRALCEEARRVYHQWKRGEFSLRIPPGLFPPRMPTLSSCMPFTT